MAYTAFAISEEDVEHVLSKFAVRVANSEGRSFAEMADALWQELDHAAIERAALHGMELDAQTRYAHDEIAAQLVRFGTLEEPPREGAPRLVAFRVLGNEEGFGPSWVQFEINDQYLARLDEVVRVLRQAGEKKAVAGLDMVEVNLNFNAHWRGRQGGFFDEADQTNIWSAVLNVAANPSTEWPLIMLAARGSLKHGDTRVETAPLELEELKALHAMRPRGEILVFENRCLVNDTPEGADFLREIREADEAEHQSFQPSESMVG
ncbi:hypothetical protein LJR175_008323 [Variovorax sp. LjRoot175]|uniref:hypothetical protein n=1 Tax=Variovorax sp. LjRoot175 TaxID=3342276 RepID=UPI003ED13DAA